MQPIISVIVPCYNQAQYLPDALDSVLTQTLNNWECVIVNDGSTDDTLVIANEWADKDNRFTVVNKENGGLAAARNDGIKASKGKYILPLDADDKIASTYLEKAVNYLEEHRETKLVYCYAKFFGDEDGMFALPDYSYEGLLWQNLIFCSAVFRRFDYDKTLGYNPNMKYGNEDWDFWLSLLNKDDTIYRIPDVGFYYRKHGISMLTNTKMHTDYNLKQILLNHIDVYEPYLCDVFAAKQKISNLEKEVENFRDSTSFRLGYAIISLLEKLRSVLCPFGISSNKRKF